MLVCLPRNPERHPVSAMAFNQDKFVAKFQLQPLKPAKVSEISEATASSPTPPEERVNFQMQDISEIAKQSGLELMPSVPGASGDRVREAILKPSREPYWKLDYKGGCQDIFFITTMDRTPEFLKTITTVAEDSGYPIPDIGVYIQPRHQGVNCHCEFSLPYSPGDLQEVGGIQELYTKASEILINQGAFFSRPYGIWADMAFQRDVPSTTLLKNIKTIFDPNGVMNPGKLCFK